MREKTIFGGSLFKGNAREKRPFSRKCATHTVMRSTHARGGYSFLLKKNQKSLRRIVYGAAKLFYIKIDRYVNVGNHIHLLIKAPSRQAQANFFRTISALIARQITNSRKGTPSKLKKFWDGKPFTRLVAWRAYKAVSHYLTLNSLEAVGFTKQTAGEYLATFSTA
jgi:REP element-mobilizing transposase RayT